MHWAILDELLKQIQQKYDRQTLRVTDMTIPREASASKNVSISYIVCPYTISNNHVV